MNNITIVHREMTAEETKQMDQGFEELYVDEGIAKESSDRYSVVAMQGENFIGCASGLAYKNGDEYSGWFYLSDLFVEKAYRSQGLGAELLNALEEKVITIGVKQIWLWTSGEKTLRFYHRQGYHQFTALENWYSDGDSRVGLRKNF